MIAGNKKIGIVLIIIGILVPLALSPFITGYKEGAGLYNNIFGIKIVVTLAGKPVNIPYRIFVAMGVAFMFMGVWCIDMAKARSKKDGNPDDGE
jgi:hypothetical protein